MIPKVKFTTAQEAHVCDLIERRLAKQRRRLEADHAEQLAIVRKACHRDLATLTDALERTRAENFELRNASWRLHERIAQLSFVRRWLRWLRPLASPTKPGTEDRTRNEEGTPQTARRPL